MGKVCEICGKGRIKAVKRKKTRSKYNPTNFYFQKPNLQLFTLPNGKRIKICTRCKKAILKGKIKNIEKILKKK
ncbi:MAG: large ribosomal subunit protein bL28 [Minisyncoccia bacterium]